MELKDLKQEYKKMQKRYYYQAHMAKLKADPEKYEEFKRKDRERQRKYYWAKRQNKTQDIKKPETVESLRAKIKKLMQRENNRKTYAKLKADPERYAKTLERNREYYLRKKAEKEQERANKLAENTEVAIDYLEQNKEEPHWNFPRLAVANNTEEKETEQAETSDCVDNKEDTKDPEVAKAYENFISSIKAYVPNITHTFEIYSAFGKYVKAYEKFLESNKKVLLDEIIKLFNK